MRTAFTALALLLLASTTPPQPDDLARWMGQFAGTAVIAPALFPACTGGPSVVFGSGGIVTFPGGSVVLRGGCQ